MPARKDITVEDVRAANRARQQRFLAKDNNRDIVNAKRRARYAAKNPRRAAPIQPEPDEPIFELEPVMEEPIMEPEAREAERVITEVQYTPTIKYDLDTLLHILHTIKGGKAYLSYARTIDLRLD